MQIRAHCAAAIVAACCVGVPFASGQEADNPNQPQTDLLSNPTVAKPAESQGNNDHLLGDFGGLRTRLADYGVTLNLIYTGEVFGNPVGGHRQGVVTDGLLEMGIDVDFSKLLGWKGATFHANGYEIHGPSGTDKYVRDIGRFSSLDAYDSVRLYELWVDQTLGDDQFSIRLGQLGADKEFCGSAAAAMFINSDFGLPPAISGNMPVPSYPEAAPGVRVRIRPLKTLYFQAAVFDGNPDPDSLGDPSPGFRPGTAYNHHGVKINLNPKEGAFSIYELGYQRDQEPGARGLPGSYKLGGWYHTDTFSDLHYDHRGRSLADPASDGIPRGISGDWGAYLVVDQMVFRAGSASGGRTAVAEKDGKGGGADSKQTAAAAGTADGTSDKGLTAFLRVFGAPSDRNPYPFYVDCGMSYKGLLPGRDADLFGVAASYTRLSDSVRALDRDRNAFDRVNTPLHDEEIVIEASYQAVVTPYWSVQPDLQVIVHPGGSSAIADALVLGLRSVVTF